MAHVRKRRGIGSHTWILKPIMPLLRRAFPNSILTTEQIGRAMIAVAQHGAAKRILEPKDINAIAAKWPRRTERTRRGFRGGAESDH